jgi:hypothetical protein
MKKSKGDATGAARGARGIDGRKGEDFGKPDFDRKRQMGERAVGQVAGVGSGDKLRQRINAQLEGDDA